MSVFAQSKGKHYEESKYFRNLIRPWLLQSTKNPRAEKRVHQHINLQIFLTFIKLKYADDSKVQRAKIPRTDEGKSLAYMYFVGHKHHLNK